MWRLWPRGQIDIDWPSLGVAWGQIFARRSNPASVWPGEAPHLALLSVRSAWDAYLGAMNWEPGSEILVSEVNIEDMVSIVRAHQLVPVPVPICPRTLSVEPSELERRITGRTKAVLIAHLFGSLMPLDGIAEAARRHNLPLIEDCAQAFRGREYHGHPGATLALFSFGIIKTQTALGGAVAFAENSLIQQLIQHTQRWPRQSRRHWIKRVIQVSLLKILSHPLWFGALWRYLEVRNHDPEVWLAKRTRGFGGEDWLRRIRQRPNHALICFLRHRLQQTSQLGERMSWGETARRQIPAECHLGQDAGSHLHWVFPIQVDDAKGLAAALRRAGFDATHSGSRVVSFLPGGPLDDALKHALFLSVYAQMPRRELTRLCEAVCAFLQKQ